MGRIITIPFTEPFIERLAGHIHEEYILKGQDLRRLGIVFGGKRPALFLKKALSARVKNVFYPPTILAIDELIGRITAPDGRRKLLDLDHCYVIYRLAQDHAPQILKGKEQFVQFLPWAREILHFFEQLDLEDTAPDALNVLQAHAIMGFNVPPDINHLLEALMVLRVSYHAYLDEHRLTSRGYQYLNASRSIKECPFPEFDRILFCNFFYLHRTEMRVIKDIYDRDQADLFMQGDERRWPALKRIAQHFGQQVIEGEVVKDTQFNLNVYGAFDMHAQAGLVAEILKEIPKGASSVVVLPNADFILPLLSTIAESLDDFNISLGYPLRRSSFYALLESIIQAHRSMKERSYYARDYLRVLRHPLVKGLSFGLPVEASRALIHKLEEILTGAVMSTISGQTFIGIDDILKDEILFEETATTLRAIELSIDVPQLKQLMRDLDRAFFAQWQDLGNFDQLALVLGGFARLMGQCSGLGGYPFNERVASRLLEIATEWSQAQFAHQSFAREDLFTIVLERLGREVVAFSGSPLKGLQILGLQETRSLSFDHVIVVDVNERILPNLNIYEPLIPREVMIKMNIDRLELEEEIQRYQFMRLISSASEVHLIYQERTDKERSRFVEELIWEQEQKANRRGVVKIIRPAFQVTIKEPKRSIDKSAAIIDFLKGYTFSASSLNTYLRNPYEFYQSHVLGLREKDDLLDEPESRHVGTFIHSLLEDAFKPYIGKKPVIDADFERRFMRNFESRFQDTFGKGMKSDSFLMKAILENRLKRFLSLEAKRLEEDVEEILYIERKFDDVIDLPCGPVRFSYRVDRVDRLKDGTVLILDYKTGGTDAMPSTFQAGAEMSRETLYEELGSFQMPLYLHYLDRQYPGKPVNAALYHLRTMAIEHFITSKTITPKEEMIHSFLQALGFVVGEIINPNIPFIDSFVDIK